MTTTVAGVRTVTELDLARLLRLGSPGPQGELQDDLADMDVVPSTDVPGDVVTMHSRVRIVHVETQRQQELTLAYPHEAHPASGLVSVQSPVGRALLGLRVGDLAQWTLPGGGMSAARVTDLLYQPEANGDLTA
jgi:regulator of nucleoside diphosphate kinase